MNKYYYLIVLLSLNIQAYSQSFSLVKSSSNNTYCLHDIERDEDNCNVIVLTKYSYGFNNSFGEDKLHVIVDWTSELHAVFDSTGVLVFPPTYGLGALSENRIQFTDPTTGNVGFMNSQAEIVIPAIFEKGLYTFKNSSVMVRKSDYYVLINSLGEEISSRYKNAFQLSEGIYSVSDNGVGYWMLNANGKKLNERPFDNIKSSGSNQYFIYEEEGNKGIVSNTGDIVIKASYADVRILSDDLFIVKNKQFYCLDSEGGLVVSRPFNDFEYLPIGNNEFCLFIQLGRTWSVYNISNRKLLGEKLLFDTFVFQHHISPNKFIVEKKGIYGAINGTGEFLVPLNYSTVKEVTDLLFK